MKKYKLGDVYRSKKEFDVLNIQRGRGGDVSAIVGTIEGDHLDGRRLFRVVLTEESINKDWVYVGNFQISPDLDYFQEYYEHDIGTEDYYITKLDDPDSRKRVNKKATEGIEPLEFYSTIHLIRRFEKHQSL